MTTNGLKRALLRSGRVRVARSFYPFHYEGLHDEPWDLLIVEGWFESANALIHEMRRVHPTCLVFYWCLDPHFPGLGAISSRGPEPIPFVAFEMHWSSRGGSRRRRGVRRGDSEGNRR